MKLFKKSLIAVAGALLLSSHAQSATYEIESAEISQLFSATFDGLVFFKAVSDDGSFFGEVPDVANPSWGVNRSIQVSPANNGSEAFGTITFDGSNLTDALIGLADTNMSIIDGPGPTIIQVEASKAQITLSGPQVDDGFTSDFDAGKPLSQGNTISVGAFSRFDGGIVTSCVDQTGNCSLLGGLNLNPVRYTISGTPGVGEQLTLKVQTDNTSYYEVVLTLGNEESDGKNVPAMGAFGLTALFAGLLAVASRLRARKQ